MLVLGITLLVTGSNFFVEYSVKIAKYLKINLVMFGAIAVAIGTSLPELGVTIDAGLNKHPEIIVGNIVGSNIANIGLILGTALLLTGIKITYRKLHREAELMLVMSLIFVALMLLGVFNWVYGLIFLIIAGFLIYHLAGHKDSKEIELVDKRGNHFPLNIIVLIGGLAAVLYGSKLTVDSAVSIAGSMGVSLGLIAATLIAVGTSLPELAVTITAAKKKQGGLAIGNIIGSNLFNILLIGGIGSLFGRLDAGLGLGYALFFTLFAFLGYLLAIGKIKPKKLYGIILLIIYGLFIGYLLVN